jgi:hypothetical protein
MSQCSSDFRLHPIVVELPTPLRWFAISMSTKPPGAHGILSSNTNHRDGFIIPPTPLPTQLFLSWIIRIFARIAIVFSTKITF